MDKINRHKKKGNSKSRKTRKIKGYEIVLHEGINRSKSLKPVLYNIPFLFAHTDIFYPQYATVAKIKE